MKAGKGLLGALIGGVIGSTVAFLFTPKRGKDVRENIKGNFDDLVNKTKDKSRQLFNQSLEMVDDIVKKSDELRALIKKYKEGTYDETIEKIEREIKRLRMVLLTAIQVYKNSKNREKSSDELVDTIYHEFKDEPMHEKAEKTH
ncbi:MAG: YtxH domain-containing protein [Ignavibacteriaceae bacterium]